MSQDTFWSAKKIEKEVIIMKIKLLPNEIDLLKKANIHFDYQKEYSIDEALSVLEEVYQEEAFLSDSKYDSIESSLSIKYSKIANKIASQIQ